MDGELQLEQTAAKEQKPQGPAAALFDCAEVFVWTVVCVMLLLICAFRVCKVSGPSMNNTLLDGQTLVVSNLLYTPDTGDIVVFHQISDVYDQFNEPIVKRVIATGGEFVKIDFKASKLYVSEDASFEEDEVLDERAYALFENPNGVWKESFYQSEAVYAVPEGYLFVLGDNRNVSADSRSQYVEFVDERSVLGRVFVRVTPLSKFGKVD